MAQPAKVRFGPWITEGFNLLKEQWSVWALMTLIMGVPVLLIYGLSQAVSLQMGQGYNANVRDFRDVLQVFAQSFSQSILLSVVTALAINIVQAFFLGGMFKAAWKQVNRQPIAVSDLFSGIDLFMKIVVAAVLITMLQFIGTLLCYIPGLIVQGLFFFVIPLIVYRQMEPLDAMRESFQTVKQDWIMFSLFAFVVNLLAALGIIACLIGILVSYPLLFLFTAVAYRDCFEPAPEVNRVEALYTKYCRNCGSPLDVKANFCDKCGAGQV